MIRLRRWQPHLALVLTFLLSCTAAIPAHAAASTPAATPGPCIDGVLPHGALSKICIPSSGWNGDLVLFGHGYVAPNEPLQFANLQVGDVSLPDVMQQLGFAFATTSYRENGLAILPGVQDVIELVSAFGSQPVVRQAGGPRHTYMLGGSEGGLITTLLVERRPDLFTGALAACGPIGDFQAQINYIGDFRVLFDYFFPNVIPGSPIAPPPEVMADWTSKYVPAIQRALAAAPDNALQLISTSHAAIDPADLSTITQTALDVLWYSVFSTTDAAQKLGGNPYGNRHTFYTGSTNDVLLNLRVEREDASPRALAAVGAYQTSGRLTKPLLTLHTTGDDVIPFGHEILYALKVQATGSSRNLGVLPVFRYRHCNFTAGELLFGFAELVQATSGPAAAVMSNRADVQKARTDFERNRGRPLPGGAARGAVAPPR